jgi:hypothetical protein
VGWGGGGREGKEGNLEGAITKGGMGIPTGLLCSLSLQKELDYCVILLVNVWHICFHVNMSLLGVG